MLVARRWAAAHDHQHLRVAGLDGGPRPTARPAAALAHDYIIDRLRPLADGLVPGQVGDAAYKQPFAPAPTSWPSCRHRPGRRVRDGRRPLRRARHELPPRDAETGSATARPTTPPVSPPCCDSRDLAPYCAAPPLGIFALWDREEDGLLGSGFSVDNPVPLARHRRLRQPRHPGRQPAAQPARDFTFAIGAETGGAC